MSEDTEKPEGETAEEESADKPQYSKAQPGARRRIRNFYSSRADDFGPTRRRHCRRVLLCHRWPVRFDRERLCEGG